MKILVVSDIHANLDAFEAVLASAGDGCAGFVMLGDCTGYGPDASACVSLLASLGSRFDPFVALLGNHDAALTGALDLSWFGPTARFSAGKTRGAVLPADVAYLSRLAPSAVMPGFPDILLSHGSPEEPLTGYLFGGEETSRAFGAMARDGVRACLCGHTHEGAVFRPGNEPGEGIGAARLTVPAREPRPTRAFPAPGVEVRLGAGPVIVNPGSAGFPRAFNGLAEEPEYAHWPAYYGVWDTKADTFAFAAAFYDFGAVVDRMRSGGWVT